MFQANFLTTDSYTTKVSEYLKHNCTIIFHIHTNAAVMLKRNLELTDYL